ncbi:MAG: hypothetical protein LBL26_10885 [Peptococcaceae bacterium]|jgi:hypothetical protein|nr:hypothetical protein [Peptococcaceae bacterium]
MSIEAFDRRDTELRIQRDLLRLELEKAKGFAAYTALDDFEREMNMLIEAAEKRRIAADE